MVDYVLDKSRPICRQICEKICTGIASGELRAGERLPSVREVALTAGVNPNTVQKSFELLEILGAVRAVPYEGWYVNEDKTAAEAEVRNVRFNRTREYLSDMERLGCGLEETIYYLTAVSNERKGEPNE